MKSLEEIFSTVDHDFFFTLKKFNVYLFLKERERQRQRLRGGEAEREGDTESEAGSRL